MKPARVYVVTLTGKAPLCRREHVRASRGLDGGNDALRFKPKEGAARYRVVPMAESVTAASLMAQIPKWQRECVQDFFAQHTEIFDLTHLAWSGITLLPRLPPLIKVLNSQNPPEPSALSLENAMSMATRAQRELDAGLPLLHAQAAIAIWSSLESFVKRVAREWIHNIPEAREMDVVRRIKVPLAEFAEMSPEARSEYIVETLERDLAVGSRDGIGGFEKILAAIGLDGGVTPDVRDELFKLKCVRNVLAHRRGVADERFVRSYPGKAYAVGAKVMVRHCCFGAFMGAASGYVYEVFLRLAARSGVDRGTLNEALLASEGVREIWPPKSVITHDDHT